MFYNILLFLHRENITASFEIGMGIVDSQNLKLLIKLRIKPGTTEFLRHLQPYPNHFHMIFLTKKNLPKTAGISSVLMLLFFCNYAAICKFNTFSGKGRWIRLKKYFFSEWKCNDKCLKVCVFLDAVIPVFLWFYVKVTFLTNTLLVFWITFQ